MADGPPNPLFNAAGPVLLRARPVSFVFPRVIFTALVLSFAGWLLFSPPRPGPINALVITVIALVELAVPVVGTLRALRQPWAVQLGPDGVAWWKRDRIVWWEDVAEVRIAAGSGPRTWLRPGVRLILRADPERESSLGDRTHVVDTRHLDASVDDVLDVIARFARLPTVRD